MSEEKPPNEEATLIALAIATGAAAQASVDVLREMLRSQGIAIDENEFMALRKAKFRAIYGEMQRLQQEGVSATKAIEDLLRGVTTG